MTNTIKFSEFANVDLNNTTNMLVGVSAPSSGVNFQQAATVSWVDATRPSVPYSGLEGYNTGRSQWEYWNGSAWVQFAAGGTGSVNAGSVNQLAWYASSGSAVSGLVTSNSSVMVTNSSGEPDWLTTLPAALSIPQPSIGGVTNGSDAASGIVGEFISSFINSGSPVSLTSSTPRNVTSISLTAGDWDIWGNIYVVFSVNSNQIIGAINTNSDSIPDAALAVRMTMTSSLFSNFGFDVPYQRLNITSTTTVYLVAQASFGSGTGTACGGIYARRVR